MGNSGHGKEKSKVARGPGDDTQARESQHETASLKQDSPTNRADSGTRKNEHYNSVEIYDKMSRWLEGNPQEEPWSAVSSFSRGHPGNG
ncbi:hypothetical protein HO173_000040 [Letharia columbiana]|uniref:Uncharacterized protein n=1 Tax=Letharia columbiana TaxID=112416 RepID=A0A8H6LAA6_9LECA|nr:uncharacterized protein HO173_000040 [Letharia columbiana]KAF6241330.1 hypothetical protein HO173_000040 [Letharia columbiana]